MVYNAKTMKALHELTEQGEEAYQDILEKEADMILLKHQHFFRYLWMKIQDYFQK